MTYFPHHFHVLQTAGDIQYNTVCDGCDNIECENCKIKDGYSRPICSELLDHTDSRGGSARLETLVMEPGYWRATNTSKNILECFNMNACRGGVTGSSEYCLRGYGGPCEQSMTPWKSHNQLKRSSTNLTIIPMVLENL